MTYYSYPNLYLDDAMENLAVAFDYAVNSLKIDPNIFVQYFINSGVASLFEDGAPHIICGQSGIELTRYILKKLSINFEEVDYKYNLQKSKEYWAGYYLAYYQWKTGYSFKFIFDKVSFIDIINMYHPYHEMDIEQFVDALNKKILKNSINKLKKMREYMKLSQSKLSKISGVNIRSIQMFEQGYNDISKAQIHTVLQLARSLKCKVEDLV